MLQKCADFPLMQYIDICNGLHMLLWNPNASCIWKNLASKNRSAIDGGTFYHQEEMHHSDFDHQILRFSRTY